MNTAIPTFTFFKSESPGDMRTKLLCLAAILVSWFETWTIDQALSLFIAAIGELGGALPTSTVIAIRATMNLHIICTGGTIALPIVEMVVKSARARFYVYVVYVIIWSLAASLILHGLRAPFP
jgi:hypothetical protein